MPRWGKSLPLSLKNETEKKKEGGSNLDETPVCAMPSLFFPREIGTGLHKSQDLMKWKATAIETLQLLFGASWMFPPFLSTLTWRTIDLERLPHTVDASEVWRSPPGMYKNPVNHGINYHKLPTSTGTGIFFHQQYFGDLLCMPNWLRSSCITCKVLECWSLKNPGRSREPWSIPKIDGWWMILNDLQWIFDTLGAGFCVSRCSMCGIFTYICHKFWPSMSVNTPVP